MTTNDSTLPDSVALDPAPPKTRKRYLPFLVLAAAAAAYLGYRTYLASRPYEWSGTVEARMIAVGSRAGGRVKDVLVREGQRVESGQPLVILEPGDLEAQRLEAQGEFDQAEANLEKLEKGARPEEIEQARARSANATAAFEESKRGARSEQIQGANSRLIAMQVAVDKAQLDADRAHKLFGAAAISQAEVDTAESTLRGTIAQRDAAKKTLEELENGVRQEEIQQAAARAEEARANEKLVLAGTRVEDLKAAHAQVEAAEGRLDRTKVMIDECVIRATRAARVEALDLRPGDILAANATAATLLEDDELYVRIYVPETLIGRIKVGDEVPITVDSFPHRSFRGVIEHINSVGEYSPRNLQTADERADQVFATRIGLREGRDDLRAGMAAFITVHK